jgi:multidrug resistance efflux pump
MFTTTQRMLDADGFRGTILAVLLIVGLLSAWGVWFLSGQVALYAVSDTARLEMSPAADPVEAPVAGRVVATHLVLGQGVQSGEIPGELDANAQPIQKTNKHTTAAKRHVIRSTTSW